MFFEAMRQRLERLDAAHDAFEPGTGGEGDLCGEAGIVEIVLALELARFTAETMRSSMKGAIGGSRRERSRSAARTSALSARAGAEADGEGRIAIDEVELVGEVALGGRGASRCARA
ncbi:MAG: hypothetical protein QM687_09315 [Ferruginibacter sp.]